MNSFDTVFVQFFDYKANLIFSRDMISNFRKSVQMLNDKSSERVIIFRFQFCSEIVIEVIQIHRTFYNIFLIIDFLDQLFFCFIVFIADLTYNLLQNTTTWLTSTEVVTVPTPPGTGVMASTTGSASPKRTSPQSLPSSLTWMPTSTTT